MALALNPRLLLLDEPTAGMGDQETYAIIQLIRRLHKDGKLTIVLIEHDMRVVFHLADRIMVLDQGKFLAEGTPQEIAANEAVQTRLSGQGRMTAALIAEGLHTYYGKSHILHGVSLEAAEGQVTALLGRNGAGKTTTLRSLMGLTPPREGTRHDLRHATTTRWPPFRVAALGVGYVPEGRKMFPNLTVDENLRVPLERPGPWTAETRLSAVSPARGAASPTAAGSYPAASRKCSRSRARCWSIRNCSFSTSRRRDWRRSSCAKSFASWRRCAPRASPCCWSSRTCA